MADAPSAPQARRAVSKPTRLKLSGRVSKGPVERLWRPRERVRAVAAGPAVAQPPDVPVAPPGAA